MIDNPREYEIMAAVEASHWWYRCLHRAVLDAIERQFESRQIQILDAGCGTGGLLHSLRRAHYQSVKGFDLAPLAVTICRDHGLDVEQGNLRDIAAICAPLQFDVIISNDNLYHLAAVQRRQFIEHVYERLHPGGLLIMNLPALAMFRGKHDRAVGVTHRFSKAEVEQLLRGTGFEVLDLRYWPVLLAPVIGLVRWWQRLTDDASSQVAPVSDLKFHAGLINNLLYGLIRLEQRWLPFAPAGSSLFCVLRKP